MKPAISRIITVSRKLLEVTGHNLKVITYLDEMPKARRDFREVYHYGRDVWIWLRKPDDLSRTVVDLFHEVGHAISPLTERHKFGRDWQPKWRACRNVAACRLHRSERDDIEMAAMDAQIAVTVLAGFSLDHLVRVMGLVGHDLDVEPVNLRRVLETWGRTDLALIPERVARVERLCPKERT